MDAIRPQEARKLRVLAKQIELHENYLARAGDGTDALLCDTVEIIAPLSLGGGKQPAHLLLSLNDQPVARVNVTQGTLTRLKRELGWFTKAHCGTQNGSRFQR